MKKFFRNAIAMVLALLMLIQAGEYGIAWAVEEVDKAVNPAEHIEITVPERFKDGDNWFFVPESAYSISEKSPDKLYIPIQRTGDIDMESEVTLKIVDLTAKHDVNYTAEIYKEIVDPDIFLADMSIKEITLNSDEQEEVEIGSESDLGELIHDAGGATLVDSDGNPIAEVTATPLDENGNPIVENETPTEENETLTEENETPTEENETPTEENETPTEENETLTEENETPTEENETPAEQNETPVEKKEPVIPGEVEEGEWTEAEKKTSPTKSLRAARDSFTGTKSDRQEIAGSSLADFVANNGSTMTEDEYNEAMADAVADNYPGKEYRLHFNAGESVKFLVVTPLYSEAAEGDAQIILLLKNPGEGFAIGEDVNPISVTIIDEDEPETVTVSMAAETVYAEDGKASITITREGRLNALVGVMLKSWGGSAKEGDEYSGVGAKLWIPMGIKSRTVEIPVLNGEEEKDFYITITALNDETIGASTTHVIIPPAKISGGEGALMALDQVNGHPLTNPINLEDGYYDIGGFDSETAFHIFTRIDKEETSHFYLDTASYGKAYDGAYVHYKGFLNWCDADFRLTRWNGGNRTQIQVNYLDDGGVKEDQWLYGAWNNVNAPERIGIEVANVDNEGAAWTDSYAVMWVDEVRLIKRQFNIRVEEPELKPLIGVDDNTVLTEYEAVFLDNSNNSTRSLWTGDSFALNAKDTKSPLRLVGIEAKIGEGDKDAWYRIATIDGKSSTVTVELTPDVIRTLDEHACITWSENGKCDYGDKGKGGKFYKGAIVVRPVFDYIDATVEFKSANPDYGTLNAEAPLPNMLWDFGSDRAMDDLMGISSLWRATNVSWTAENQDGRDYYRFTASGNDPYVSVADHAESIDNIRYLKFAAKNLNGASYLQLFASANNAYIGPSNIKIPLYQDTEWHEYVVDLTKQPNYQAANWKGALTWFRLDPMDGNVQNGSAILIDYMAFFSSEGSARTFRATEDDRVSGLLQLTYHVGDVLTLQTEVNEAGASAKMHADGFFYELHTSNAEGFTHNAVDQHYLNGSLSLQLTDRDSAGNTVDHPYYNIEPTFTENGNLTVIIPDASYAKLNKTAGLCAESDYYRFVASSDDPQVSIDTPVNASYSQWVKIRARNVSGVDGMKLFAGSGEDTVNEASGVTVTLNKDKGWHEYVVNLTGWTGIVEWFRLDPMEGNTVNGSQIQIDYIAFFPDEARARAFQNNGTGYPSLLWDFNKAGGPVMGGHCNANVSYVGISDDEGNFVRKTHEGDHWVYVVDEKVWVNDLYEINAYVADPDAAVVKWTLSDGSAFYGDTLYFRSKARARDNVITLEVYEGRDLVYMQLAGTVVTSTMNLSSGRSATDKNPVEGAILTHGYAGAVTDENGAFTFPALLARAGGKVRYLVSYNGVSTIQEATVPGLGAGKKDAVSADGKLVQAIGADLGEVRTDTYSATGAHFISVTANQYGKLRGALNAVAMNGQRLTVIAKVAPGDDYVLNHETYTEHIKEVRLYFQDQYTGERHGIYSSLYEPAEDSPAKWSWNPETGEFVLRIYPFDPEHPTEWTYGDVLMAQLTTDKRGVGADGNGEMVYDAVSTGFGVYADPDYKPRTFDYDIDDLAETLQITPGTDEDGDPIYDDGALQDDDTRYSYGAFPYLGEITSAIRIVSKLVSTAFMSEEARMMEYDLNIASSEFMGDTSDFDDTMSFDVGKTPGAWQSTPVTFSMFFTMTDNFYGGVRFMLGAIFTYGAGNQYERTRNTKANLQFKLGDLLCPRKVTAPEVDPSTVTNELIYNQITTAKTENPTKETISKFGGPYFTVSVYFGVYLCYGYVEISKNGGVEKSHEMVFMGAGGFIGFGSTVGYTWAFMAGPIPLYVNVEAGIKLTFYLGSEADPNKTLAEANSSGELHGQDFSFNFSMDGRIYVTGTFGAGLPKLLGVRVSVTVGFNTGYNQNVPKWYPELFDDGKGYTMDATFTGTIDIIVTSIDVYSATWPIPVAGGYLYWFQEANRGNKCISYVENGLAKGKGDSEAARTQARAMINELIPLIDNYTGKTEQIREKTYALKNYAYDHDIIDWVTKNTIEMNKQAGIGGAIINGVLQDDTAPGGIRFHTQPHVDSQWVADDGELMSAYSVVKTTPIMEDAFHQPNSKIINIGNNKFLVAFLDDTASRDSMMASTLKWTVYDATNDTWTEPETVQDDYTMDSRPSLADADDKVILSWASATDEKYVALKETFASELKTALGREPADFEIVEAMEADPARVMSIMDIFTVEFDKQSESFGEITQLTDDEYYDDYPLAVYDEGTKDYIVIYYKTAQDDEAYDNAGDKLNDIVSAGADPDKTYSMVCYMLYNGVADTNAGYKDDTGNLYDVPAGWVRDFLYENEFDPKTMAEYDPDQDGQIEGMAGYIADYAGERFLPSTILTESGEYADPPINDLTVASGLDGLAAFAFTVDKDFNMNTAEDRELYMQYYNFETHGTYVPIRVAGDRTKTTQYYNTLTEQFETHTVTEQVEVGTPKLVRNGGNTFLFWRENGTSVKYLNVSRMLKAKVAAVADPDPDVESDWTYAVKDDGTFAVDAVMGKAYAPNVQTVEVLSSMTDEDIHITDFDFITDDEDNLYVVWTDVVTVSETDEFGQMKLVPAQEIFVSGMVQQDAETVKGTDEEGQEYTDASTTARWSKPYRLTRENAFNDGLALALDDNGGLIIVHNQFTKQIAQSEEEMMSLIAAGKIGVTTDRAGNYYAASIEYNSPIRMMVTRCDKVGSLEATEFTFSDELPVAGQVIGVQAAIENVGLTNAKGFEIEFYEYKDGVKGQQIGETITSDETIPVNTAAFVTFPWTVPADGPEGYSILASVREKNSSGYYDAIETRSETLQSLARFRLDVGEITQDGDEFIVNYTVRNTGNKAVPEGYDVKLLLSGLYGDLDSAKYGFIEDELLYSKALTLPAKTAEATSVLVAAEDGDKEVSGTTVTYSEFSESARVTIPASVFRFCGYDAVQIVITDKDGTIVADGGDHPFRQTEPMNLSLNGGKTVSLSAGSTKQVALDYDSNVFIDGGTVLYSVQDPTVASVSAHGELMGLANGTTTLTATMLPSGRTTSITVNVNGYNTEPGNTGSETINVGTSGEDDSIEVSATIEGSTAAVSAPTEAQLETIAEKAKETGSVTIDLSSLPEGVTAASIPAETIKAINDAMDESGAGMTVKLPDSSVKLDTEALSSITAQAAGTDIVIHVETVDESALNANQKEAFKDEEVEAVYDVYITADNERIAFLGDGRASITVTHEAKKDQKLSGFSVVYAAEDGTKEKIPTVARKDSVTFTVNHFSNYILTYSDPGDCAKDDNCPMSAFSDLNMNQWYHDGVHWALENGFMNGLGDGKFGPDDNTNRAMIVTMLHRLEGTPKVGNELTFTDVKEGEWYSEAIRWAAANGIVGGYGDGRFGPEDTLTREQLAVILCRYARYKGIDTAAGELKPLNGFNDAAAVSEWAVKEMRWAVDEGIINGVGNDTISPKTSATRAQVATMLMRYSALDK